MREGSASAADYLAAGLIAASIAVNIWSTVAHIRLVRQLKRGESVFCQPSALAAGLAILLAAFGLAMAIQLVSISDPRDSNLEENSMSSSSENGIVTLRARQSVDETVQKLERMLEERAIKMFAVIDHSGEAHQAGLEMPATKLLIFGNPSAGTPLMIAAPDVAIDLPLKFLVREDRNGQTLVSYNSPSYLQERHALSAELIQKLAVVEALARAVAE